MGVTLTSERGGGGRAGGLGGGRRWWGGGRSEDGGLETRGASGFTLSAPSSVSSLETLFVAHENNVSIQGMFSPGFFLLPCRYAPSHRSPLHKFYFTSLVF